MGNSNYRKAKYIDILKYSFGGVGSNLPFLMTMMYLSFYFTDIYGIDPKVVAGLMLVARIIDAFTDPLMGILADNTKSKYGKYRPWIIFGAPILGISVFLLFTTPNLSPNTKVSYAYIVYISYSLISTIVNIPYHSLTPTMSEDPVQRTTIVMWKQGMGMIPPQLLVGMATLPIIGILGGGAQAWSVYGAIIGVLTTLSFWMCAWGGKSYDKVEVVSKENREKINVFKDLQLLFKNKPMMMLIIAFGTDILAYAAQSAVNVYYFKYVLEREDLIPVVGLITLGVVLIVIFMMPILTKIFGKKKLYWYATFLSIIPLSILLFYPSPTAAMVMFLMATMRFVATFPGFLGWSMIPECSDYAEWKFGKRADGLMSGSITFINKLGMAIGGSAAMYVLGTVGFVANQPQTDSVKTTIVILQFGLPILGYICSLISMHFYEIDNEKYKEIRTDLDARKSK